MPTYAGAQDDQELAAAAGLERQANAAQLERDHEAAEAERWRTIRAGDETNRRIVTGVEAASVHLGPGRDVYVKQGAELPEGVSVQELNRLQRLGVFAPWAPPPPQDHRTEGQKRADQAHTNISQITAELADRLDARHALIHGTDLRGRDLATVEADARKRREELDAPVRQLEEENADLRAQLAAAEAARAAVPLGQLQEENADLRAQLAAAEADAAGVTVEQLEEDKRRAELRAENAELRALLAAAEAAAG